MVPARDPSIILIGSAALAQLLSVAGTCAAGQPPMPLNIRAGAMSLDRNFISWDYAGPAVSSFEIQRAVDDPNSMEFHTTVPGSERLYFDSRGIEFSRTYYYKVTAFDADGNASVATPVVASPQSLESPHFRVFFNTDPAFAPAPTSGETAGQLNHLPDDRDDRGQNVYAVLALEMLEGIRRELLELGFKEYPLPAGLDRLPLNVKAGDSGGSASVSEFGPLIQLQPINLTRHDPRVRLWDPFGLSTLVHEYFHIIQDAYPYHGSAPQGVIEGQARAIQDLTCLHHRLDPCAEVDHELHGGFWGAANGYLESPVPFLRTSYEAALFWSFLCQEYGQFRHEPQLGVDFIQQFWELSELNPGKDHLDLIGLALDALGRHEGFQEAYRSFAVACFLRGRGLSKEPFFVDEQQQPGPWEKRVPFVEDMPLGPGDQAGPRLITVERWEMKFFQFHPTADLTHIHLEFHVDSPHPAEFVIQTIRDGLPVAGLRRRAVTRDFSRTIENEGYQTVGVVVVGLEHDVNLRYSVNASRPVLRVLDPLASRRAIAGSLLAPRRILVKLEALNPDRTPVLGLTRQDFQVHVGSEAVSPDAVTAAFVQGQYWLLLPAPVQTAGAGNVFDLTVSWEGLTAVEQDAVVYSSGVSTDTVIVLDASGSMDDPPSKLASALEASRLYVDSFRDADGTGLVTFSKCLTSAMALSDLSTGRSPLLTAIGKVTAAGGTSIGDGLRRGLQLLTADGAASRSWAMILISDGLNTCGTDIAGFLADDYQRSATRGRVPVIHTVAIGADADRTDLQDLAARTGGVYHFAAEPPQGDGGGGIAVTPLEFHLRLSRICREVSERAAGHEQLLAETGRVAPGGFQAVHVFLVEPGVAELVLAVSGHPHLPIVRFRDLRTGQLVTPFRTTDAHAVHRVVFPLAGTWRVEVQEPPCAPEQPCSNIEYLVEASARSQLDMELILGLPAGQRLAGLPVPILVALNRETVPVTGARVEARVTPPGGTAAVLRLLDDGLHGDGEAADGLYGETYLQGWQPGSYGVEVTARGAAGTPDDFLRREEASFHLDGTFGPDGDFMTDEIEARLGLDPTRGDGSEDPDGDEVPNGTEVIQGTHPFDADTDDDGEADGSELRLGRNPVFPGDGIILPPRISCVPGAGKVWIHHNVPAGALSFRVYRAEGPFSSPDDGDFRFLTFAPAGRAPFRFVDTDVQDGTTYRYRFASNGAQALSAPCAPCEATPRADPYPPQGSVLIEGGAPTTDSTSVELTLRAGDNPREAETPPNEPFDPRAPSSGVTRMWISNHAGFEKSRVLPFHPTTDWELEPGAAGIATVHVRFEDGAGNLSGTAQATIRVESGPLPAGFRRGDSNLDGRRDVSDAIHLLGFLFLGSPSALPCLDAADSNDDGTTDISDAVALLDHLFLGGRAPPAPFPGCGVDPTADGLDCADQGACG